MSFTRVTNAGTVYAPTIVCQRQRLIGDDLHKVNTGIV